MRACEQVLPPLPHRHESRLVHQRLHGEVDEAAVPAGAAVHRPLSEEAPLRPGALGQRRQGGAQVRCGIPEPFGRITCQFRVEYSVVAVHPADTYPAVSGGARPRWLAAPGAVAELGHEEAQGHAHVRGTRALR